MLKTLVLALALVVTPAIAADTPVKTYNRTTFKAECIKQAPKEAAKRVVNAVCECATQYIAYETAKGDRFADFTISEEEPLVSLAVPVCLELGDAVGADKFFEAFEQTEVGARAR